MRFTRIKGKRVSGFTLVEMAIVLVIIGIILAGIMKGRDIVRGSQVKQFSQGFAQKWVTIASSYFDKVGQQLYDGIDNGGTAASPDGLMDGAAAANWLDNNAAATAPPTGTEGDVKNALNDVGITPCTMIKSDLEDLTNGGCTNDYNIFERMVDGEWTGKSRVVVGFFSVNANGNRNIVAIANVPPDVAIGLDTIIDGVADGENGACVNFTDPTAAAGAPTAAPADYAAGGPPFIWPTASGANGVAKTVTVGIIMDY